MKEQLAQWLSSGQERHKIRLIAFFGPSASGKDTIVNMITEHKQEIKGKIWHKVVPITTRPPREGEIHGDNYSFVSDEYINHNLSNIICHTQFRGWHYAYDIDDFLDDPMCINYGVFNDYMLEELVNDSRFDIFPVMVWAESKTRLLRSLYREDNPDCIEICRRFLQDSKDYSRDFKFQYIKYDTTTGDPENMLNLYIQVQKWINRTDKNYIY